MLSLQSLLFLSLVGEVEVVGVVCAFDLVESCMFFGLELASVVGVVQELVVVLLVGEFLCSLDLFFLFDLFIEVLFLESLLLAYTIMVGEVLADEEGDSRAVFSLWQGRILSEIGLFGSFH